MPDSCPPTLLPAGPSWAEAVEKWRLFRQHVAPSSWRTGEVYARRLSCHLATVPLAGHTRVHVELFRAACTAEGLAPKTINLHLETWAAILSAARESGWHAPAPKMRKERILIEDRQIEPARLDDLLTRLPEHQRDMAVFSLDTGMRRGNVCALRRRHVDVDRQAVHIPAPLSKTRRPLPVPLGPVAWAIVARNLAAPGGPDTPVFQYEGAPLHPNHGRSWYKHLRAAGLAGTRWHDLRHTWASWHAQDGTPERALMELGGWSSLAMVHRYSHLRTMHLRPYVENRRPRLPAFAGGNYRRRRRSRTGARRAYAEADRAAG